MIGEKSVAWYVTGEEKIAGQTMKVCATSIDASQITIEQALRLQKLAQKSRFINDEVEILFRDEKVTVAAVLNATSHTNEWCKMWVADVKNAFCKAGIIIRHSIKCEVRGVLTL